jgi:monofunctional biosynthetic peptidoglycan transglycosylase
MAKKNIYYFCRKKYQLAKKASSNKLWGIVRKFMFRMFVFFFAFSIISVVLLRWLPVRYTTLMLVRYIENIENDDYRNIRKWTPIDQISENVILAVIAAEDGRFMEHFGIDWDAVKKARKHNKIYGTRLGASTITQQTAKNIYLLPSHILSSNILTLLLRKAPEAYFSFLMEIFWSKKRIVEVYLNIIEVGDGLYGIETAAQTYFGKSASELSINEASQIASILPNPRKLNINKPTEELKEKQRKIRTQMLKMKRPVW